MSLSLKLTRELYNNIIKDLDRPHSFAYERVGFVFGRIGNKGQSDELIILNRYLSVDDNNYEKNKRVGASINSRAIRDVMQKALNDSVCVFHVHLHYGTGRPGLSRTDKEGITPLIPSFQAVCPLQKHGILLFNEDSISAWVLSQNKKSFLKVDKVSIIGYPINILY